MKKLFFIIPIITLLALTGCFNKNAQPKPLEENASTTDQSAFATTTPNDFYGDAKIFGSKKLGWEIKFNEPYNKIDCPDCIGGVHLLFGPLKPEPTPDATTSAEAPAYALDFAQADSVNNEIAILKANVTMPGTITQKKIGNFDVLTWKDGGECENRMLEVFGAKYNLIMSSLGCSTTEKDDFNYFENTVKSIKKLN